ncbi:GNAT family N-acetyltransferase [Pseudanabaena sp. FACHB-2040]|uniref:GNAT family N-acetyltransferase n=1 Tax=Pseudanabaena sp. FACHB-2040 TaxID=2692859 RepID=UPI00168A0F95|nr:GNAT family N-acetyltransferase [Pseudanabaena sp. FACHB-2040]MBD2259693.1 GNAT family N-acetyltransferase [Pseudanabaena sp. FACHB-2040]
MSFLPGYCLQRGSGLDRALLVKVMQRAHSEISPGQSLSHVAATVDQHFSGETPLWWVYPDKSGEAGPAGSPVACLWLGNAIDQRSGERHAYVLLLFVEADHRRQGLATALLKQGHKWAQQRGDRQIALQVLSSNEAALQLYQKLGYIPASVLMTRPLE